MLRKSLDIRTGREWDRFEGLATPPKQIEAFLASVPFVQQGARRLRAATFDIPADLPVTIQPVMSTQAGFGAILNEAGKSEAAFAKRIVTASPDVTVSTNLGPWVRNPPQAVRPRSSGRYVQERTHPPRSTGNSRRRASISNSASRR